MADFRAELIPHYVTYVRRHSRLATQDDHFSALRLAAHLFAVAEQLVKDDHDLRDLPVRKGFDSLADLEDQLSELSEEISGPELYRLLTLALNTIEWTCCSKFDEDHTGRVRIEELEIGDQVRLGGRVIYWVRPRRLFRALRDDGFETASKKGANLPAKRREHPGRHLDRLFCLWTTHNAVLEIERAVPVESHASFLVARGGARIAEGEPFRIALCPLVGLAKPQFVLMAEQKGFRTSPSSPMTAPDGHAVRDQIEVLLELAGRESIDVIVLPELMVDPQTREWLVGRLATSRSCRPSGVVAGSFHFDRDGSSPPLNESCFLDESGRPLLTHHKRGLFRITKPQAEDCVKKELFEDAETTLAALESLPPGVEIEEHISPGRRLELFEGALGQIAVLICADAIDTNRREMLDAVTLLRPDFVIVPSMSPETARFERFADQMEELGVATLFVNARCICPKGEVLAALCLNLYGTEDGPATRVRWRRGWSQLEEWRRGRKPAQDRDGKAIAFPDPKPAGHWRELDPASSACSFLASPTGPPLGLVVDLGAYWRSPGSGGQGSSV